MSHRRRERSDHARPVPAARSSSLFLTPLALEPLSGRRPRRLPAARAWLAATSAGLALALSVPIAVGSLSGGGGRVLQPLGGDTVGAVTAVEPSTSASPSSVPAATVDPARVPPRPTDPDAPPTLADRLPPPIQSLTGYRWPISVGRVTLPFKLIPGGQWTRDGQRLHDGLDMASFCGAPVGAAHQGVVLAAGRHFDDQLGWIGNLVPYYRRLNATHSWGQLPIAIVIDDGNGYRSVYAHFRDVTVRAGQHVRAGQLIGHEGATGHASGCHVHYGLFSPRETKRFGLRADIRKHMKLPAWEIARIDPLLVLPGGDVALKTRQIAKAIAAAKAAGR